MSCSVAGRGGWQAEGSLAVSPRGGNIRAEVVTKERAWQLGDREKQSVTGCAAEATAVAINTVAARL